MINFLKKMIGMGPQTDVETLINNGAIIVDVRTKSEYQSGHVKGSLNIPLDVIQNQYSKLTKDKPIITCCASGMRSASAKNLLIANGFTEVYNGGSWLNLKRYKE